MGKISFMNDNLNSAFFYKLNFFRYDISVPQHAEFVQFMSEYMSEYMSSRDSFM